MIILLYLILIIVFAFLSVDFYINLNEWQNRIHIGRWLDRQQWQQAVEKKAWLWVEKSPSVRTSNNTRLLLWDMLTGKYRNRTVQSWQDAGLLLGLGENACREYIAKRPDLFNNDFETDQALLAFVLAKYGCLSDKQKQVVIDFFKQYTDTGETIPYRKHVKNLRFVDTIGMIVPFLHLVGMDAAAAHQVADYDKALFRGIYPSHAYNLETDLPLGVHDWARGLGWYILGLIFSMDVADHSERIVELANALSPLQKTDGSYACFVFNRAERMESSGTALIGLLMLRAFEITSNIEYLNRAKCIESSLMRATRRDGALDYCQADTQGTGFYSHVFSTMPFAQGILLLLSKEIDKYEE